MESKSPLTVMGFISRLIVGLGLVLSTGAMAQGDITPIKMRATSAYPADVPVGKAMDFFAQRVSELSGGKMTVQVFHSGKLYSEDKSVQGVIDGTVDFSMASASNHGPFTKAWLPVETPFLLDRKQFRDLIIRGDIGRDIKVQAQKDGLHALMIVETGGHRVVGGSSPVRLPADIKQAKIRAAQSPVILNFYRTLGANPVAVPWGETYLALASKTVDAVDTNMTAWWMGNLGEAAKHLTTIYWAPTSSIVGTSTKWWADRTPAQRAILERAAKEAEELSMKLEDENDPVLRALLKKQGVQIYDPTEAELAEWRKVGQTTWASMPGDQKMIERIKTAVEKK